MPAPSFHTKQLISASEVDPKLGLQDYSQGQLEDYSVVCHNEPFESGSTLELSVLDIIMPRNWIPFTYAFENTAKHHNFMNPDNLKASLAKALAMVPSLAGRLQCDDGTAGMDLTKPRAPTRILLNNKGAWFASTTMKTSFSDMRSKYFKTALIPAQFLFNRFIKAAADPNNGDVPLLAVKAVYFECGSVSLTVYINHFVCDGRGMYEFVRLWGQLNRGMIPDPLVDSRHIVLGIPKLDSEEIAAAQARFLKSKPFQPSMTDMQLCRVSIPDPLLKTLKQEINAKLAPEWISSDDLYFCVLRRMLHRARKSQAAPYYIRTVDIRSDLGLDNSAFGNFVNGHLEGPFEMDNLLNLPLEEAVYKMRSELKSFKEERVPKAVREFVSVHVSLAPDQLNDIIGSRDIGSTSLASLIPSRIDFQGSPAIYFFGCYYLSGIITINPVVDGHFNGVIGIEEPFLHDFVNDPEAKHLGFTVLPLQKLLFK
ncbi:hypothetical protein DSO57_1004780 [Entomophthora muscae]|uniref:Uncharacterized protein n=1 Tax=Entomophthora muscae TaxID=34485 RepID=A0ACC2UTG7_9FUNG|nr:hypothetical protein DSO57_1004780 [Entomophthora muscae]